MSKIENMNELLMGGRGAELINALMLVL